jgi:tetratricopeptide (TPR) repeat protein
MRKIFLAVVLMLAVFVAGADAQLYKSETARKAGEKLLQGDRAAALAILNAAIEKRKDLLEAYEMRAGLRSMGGDLDGAIADYTSALEINPNNPKMLERRATFRTFKRDYAGALGDLDAAVANGLKTERVYTARAAVKRDLGDTEGAIRDYQAALAVNPSHAAAHEGLASTLERMGDVEGAILQLQRFLDAYEAERDGKLPKVKGEILKEPGATIKREGNERDGTQAYMDNVGITTTFRADSPEEMERQQARYEQAKNLAVAYANLGRLYAKKSDDDRALENYEKGLKIDPGDFYIPKLRSEVRIRKGDLQGAVADLTFAVNARGGAPDAHSDRAVLLTLQGRDDEAEKERALHLQMFPQAGDWLGKKIEEAKKLRSEQKQQ